MAAGTTHLRSDALDNRERVLTAARALFAERGVDVGVREIARAAGVGPATVYRRFPTKQALVEAAFGREMADCEAIVARGCAAGDPWEGLVSVVRELVVLNSRNLGFVVALAPDARTGEAIAAQRRELHRMLADLTRRAQAAGRVRADFGVADLVLLLRAGRGLSASTPQARDADARRFADLALDAIRAR
ncbi:MULTISPECIES: TetR/AcrR family transcriptional regulator [Actinosynnema]|uniref:TetR/AcrR family transcriptional regulator n=1 Tax=Actinosynnema TaxID=40566 RepID=UPI0026464E94|nr:TetR/AcrR family transcriptional regulator [Actinosynnema pretiosum]MCP2094975.1 transcriptional regulator, TetR family [Actinosynnema pretiosum]